MLKRVIICFIIFIISILPARFLFIPYYDDNREIFSSAIYLTGYNIVLVLAGITIIIFSAFSKKIINNKLYLGLKIFIALATFGFAMLLILIGVLYGGLSVFFIFIMLNANLGVIILLNIRDRKQKIINQTI